MKYKIKLEGVIDLEEVDQSPSPTPPTGELLNSNPTFDNGLEGWRVNKAGENPDTIVEVVDNRAFMQCSVDKRAEIILLNKDVSDTLWLDFDTQYWIGGRFELINYADDLPPWYTVVQLHGVPSNWNNCCAGRTLISIKGGNTDRQLEVYAEEVQNVDLITSCSASGPGLWKQPIENYQNRKVDFVYHINPSLSDNGFIKVWIDHNKVIDIKGPNTYRYDTCGVAKETKFYLQTGIYKDDNHNTLKQMYVDSIRVGNSDGNYALVDPRQDD